MTSISTEKISRGRATRDPLIHPLPAFTRIAGVPRSPHSSDGHSRFASRSAYPSFSNLSGHPTVGRDSFGAGAWPPTIGFTIVAAQAWSPTPLQIAAIVGGVVLFASLLILWTIHLNKKDDEAAEYIGKGGEPRNFTEHKQKLIQDIVGDFLQVGKQMDEAPHILTCPQGIIRYRPKIPRTIKMLSALSEDDDSEQYKKMDATILKLLETDPNLDLAKYASGLGIELVDFHRVSALPAPPAPPRIFALKNIVLSYELKDSAKSHDEIEQQLRLILDAHPSADLNALASDLGITIRNIQRKGDDGGFQPYDLPIGTKSP